MLDIQTARELFELLEERFEENADRLNRLDAGVGDGDHGTSMRRAFWVVRQALKGEFATLGELFDCAANLIAENTGGAIGPLLAALIAEGGVVFQGKKGAHIDEIVFFFEKGLGAIKDVGGAAEGEKTLIDSLAPAVKILRQQVDENTPVLTAFERTARAAEQGALATIDLAARHGRARFLGERSRGYQDGGAASIAILFEAIRDFLGGARAKSRVGKTPYQNNGYALNPVPGKFINHPDQAIREELEGLALAYPRHIQLTQVPGVLRRVHPKEQGKVGLAIGHGGGHTPSMAGFIGRGLLDADAYGPLFTCASGLRIAQAIEQADCGAGVVLLVSNHAGDVLNARLAVQRAKSLHIPVRPVSLGDDVATAPRNQLSERRGLGGLLFALKVGGAAAEAGLELEQVAGLMALANERTATLAVAVRAPTHPATGIAMFELERGQMEIGTGVHGEVGVYRGPHLQADDIIDLLVDELTADLKLMLKNKRVWVFINGSGGTSLMELHILFRRTAHRLAEKNLAVASSVVGSYFTTQDMGGFSLSLGALDEDLEYWWNQVADGALFRWP